MSVFLLIISNVAMYECSQKCEEAYMFNDDTYTRRGPPVKSLVDLVIENENVTYDRFCNLALQRKH